MKAIKPEPIYRNGLHYDVQHKNYTIDIPFYLRQVKKYGDPVLELACGTGRIAIPIAERGYKITGLDISDSMLAQARKNVLEKKLNIRFIKADCRDFRLNQKFKVILFPFNSIAHLHTFEDIKSCFICVRKHLKRNGRFIVDMFNPRLDILMRDPKKRRPVSKYPNPYGKGMVVISENNVYDRAAQISHIK